MQVSMSVHKLSPWKRTAKHSTAIEKENLNMLNSKLDRIHTVISYAYFFFVGLGLLFVVLGLIRGEADGYGFGLACIFLAGPIGLFHRYASKGARLGTRWGRNMSRGFGTLALFGFPLGTALGAYILSQTGAKWQAKQPPAET